MNNTVIKIEGLSKLYRLGEIGTGTLSHDLNGYWYKLRGKDDPHSTVDASPRKNTRNEDLWALRDLNLEIEAGETLGIIGKNGAGKSTLLKILSRITSPTNGRVKIKGRIAALLEVGTGFHPELTGRENIFLNGAILGMTRREIRTKLDDIVSFSGVGQFIDTPVKRYSTGMALRLGFAVGAFLEPEILIVDEVLAVGDAEFQSKCLGKIKEVSGVGRTVLFVSHNMSAVRSLCRNAILLENGRLSKTGKADEVVKAYLQLNSEIAATGIIPIGFKSGFGNGEAKFKQVSISSETGSTINELHFGQKFSVSLKIDVNRPVRDCTIGIIVGTDEVHRLIFIKDDDYKSHSGRNFEAGVHTINVLVKCKLMPGRYFLSAMLFEIKGGYTIDFVENIFAFSVLQSGWEAGTDLPDYIAHGLVASDSLWNYAFSQVDSGSTQPPVIR
jgi:lipopolysaccharide transport system ATP-binding protein